VGSSRRRLSPSEIAERIRARFGDDLTAFEDVHGHPVLTVVPERYEEIARFLRDEPDLSFDFFDFLTGVDLRSKDGGFDVITHLYSTGNNQNVRIRVHCDADEPRCPTLTTLWPGASWHERETWELFGIVFDGHPHLVKLLLPEQFEGHPLRKDFVLMTREAKPWPGAVPEGEEIEE
jgi:NADH-quinone oxidoreductase subunit C